MLEFLSLFFSKPKSEAGANIKVKEVSFDDIKAKELLFDAIKAQNVPAIEGILQSNPDALNERLNGDSPLHLVIKNNFAPAVNAILKVIQQNPKFKPLLSSQDALGYSPLHLAAHYASAAIVDQLIIALGPLAHDAALKVDLTEGKVPLFLSQLNSTQDRKSVKRHLKAITVEATHEDLTKPILFEDVLKLVDLTNTNAALLHNLNYGCIAASHLRQYVFNAPTHNNSNSLNFMDYSMLWNRCTQLRSDYKSKYGGVNSTDDNMLIVQKLEEMNKYVKQYHLANCGEYADLVAYTLAKLGIHVPIEVYRIVNGDHVFVVLGRAQNSSISDYKTWGPSAVIIDAWAGKVYPAQELDRQLKAYQTYWNAAGNARRASVSFHFEPKFHQLLKKYSIKPAQVGKPNEFDLSILNEAEKRTFHENQTHIKNLQQVPLKRRRLG